MPLVHPPGEAQVDFGHAHVILDGQEVKVAVFVMTLMYSDAVFCCVFPRECSETFLEGHRRAFEFFRGVPRRIAYDNTKTAVAKMMTTASYDPNDLLIPLSEDMLHLGVDGLHVFTFNQVEATNTWREAALAEA